MTNTIGTPLTGRTFNGTSSDRIQMQPCSANLKFSGSTVAAIIRAKADGVHMAVISPGNSLGTNEWEFYRRNNNAMALWCDHTGSDELWGGTLTASVANGWCLVAATKAAGSAVIRGHRKILGLGTWLHTDGAAQGDSPTPLTDIWAGCTLGNTDFFNGQIAAIGIWNEVFTDAMIEALVRYPAWFANSGTCQFLMYLDQKTNATPVDISQNAAVSAGGTGGMSVSTDGVPGFDYGQPVTLRTPF